METKTTQTFLPKSISNVNNRKQLDGRTRLVSDRLTRPSYRQKNIQDACAGRLLQQDARGRTNVSHYDSFIVKKLLGSASTVPSQLRLI
ncbi:hypothetical protein ABVT39_011050 [Epinephelus coioides]